MIKKQPAEKPKIVERFVAARGGRKTANAYARVFQNKTGITVNDKDYKDYFKTLKNQMAAIAPFEVLKIAKEVGASVRVYGGGINAQAEAVRNAISRALAVLNVEFKGHLRRAGFMTRDARMVERKKYGLKKARRAPQWAKR